MPYTVWFARGLCCFNCLKFGVIICCCFGTSNASQHRWNWNRKIVHKPFTTLKNRATDQSKKKYLQYWNAKQIACCAIWLVGTVTTRNARHKSIWNSILFWIWATVMLDFTLSQPYTDRYDNVTDSHQSIITWHFALLPIKILIFHITFSAWFIAWPHRVLYV